MKKILTLIIACSMVMVTRQASAQSIGCDTISNLTSIDTLELYSFNGGYTGFVAGNNSYGDLEKAEFFSGPVGSQLTGAFLGFGYANILPADSATTVTINVYDSTGTDGNGNPGAPGNVITSATVTLRQIANAMTAGTELYVSFPAAPTLVAQGFFISVVLPTTGDTIALYTNQFNSYDGNGWESDASTNGPYWASYQNDFETFPYTFGNDIQAVTCGGGPLAAFHSSLLFACGGSNTIYFENFSSNGVTSFSWAFPGGSPATSTSATPTVTYSAGTYEVQLIAVGATSSDTATAVVYVDPAITATTSTTPATSAVANNGSATANALTGVSPYTYFWYSGTSSTDTLTSQTFPNQAPGTYYVQISDAYGCYIIDSAVIGFTSSIVALSGGKTVQIFPMPASNVLNISWSAATTAELTISDMSGKMMTQYAVENSLNNSLDINELAAGTYVLTIAEQSSNTKQSVKFIKY